MSQWIIPASVAKFWRVGLIAAGLLLIAAIGTYVSGQYRIGRLDALIERYQEPVADYAAANSRARAGTVEAELLESCKQAQIGTWLQTTDALKFKDPVTGNRIVVQLEAGHDYIDINGREISSCVTDELEDRQYDIDSMTTGWSVGLLLASLLFGGLSLLGRRRAIGTI